MNAYGERAAVSAAWMLLLLLAATGGRVRGGDAVAPGKIELKATFNCIGIKWDLEGDDDGDARCTVSFRRAGTKRWRQAMELFRVRFKWRDNPMNNRGRNVNALCGSLFHLAPGTAYEVRLRLEDPDGGGAEKTLAVSTHALPQHAPDARVRRVKPGELQAAVNGAKPGDVLLLDPGDHGGGLSVTASGAPGKLIVIRGAGKGASVIHGPVRVKARYVWFDNLTVECKREGGEEGMNGFNGDGSSMEIYVTRCRILNAYYGCNVYGYRWFVTDNLITGDKPAISGDVRLAEKVKVRRPLSGEGVDFHHHPGGCCVAAFNKIARTADGISYGHNNIDVYHNELFPMTDDNIEPDYAYHNYRIWGNTCWGGVAGISFQPFNGGPWYVFRNQITGNGRHILKLKEGYGPQVFVNNTLVQPRAYKRFQILLAGVFANNVWIQIPPGRIGRGDGPFPAGKMRLMDYNLYGSGKRSIWDFDRRYTLEALRALKVDLHSRVVDPREVLVTLPESVATGTGTPLLPKPGSACIDGGTVIPNLVETYAGKAPDVGAYEYEFGPNWTGPRDYTPGGLAYGTPPGWRTAPAEELKKFASLGAPAWSRGLELLLVRKNPDAFLAVRFEPGEGEGSWKRFEDILRQGGGGGKTMRFLDSLAARLAVGNASAAFYAAQRTPRGVWHIRGGCAAGHARDLAPAFYAIVRSMQQTVCLPGTPVGGG